MGLCGSSLSAEQLAEKRANELISKGNKKDAERENEKIKLLLLGAGESGKSTIFKQMKILYGSGPSGKKGFGQGELTKATLTIYSNIISDFQQVLEKSAEFGPYDPSLKESAAAILELPYDAPTAYVDETVGKQIKDLWADEGIKKTWLARANFQVQDALQHYCDSIDRISRADYVPTTKDVLLTRVRTSGIVEENYTIDGVNFVMFDVGGQRNERRKWIHCFEDVTAVIFVAAINEYDQVLYEDNNVNRMDEAVILFDEICNSKWFVKTSMILFLNKRDLFREKLPLVPFRVDDGPNQRFTDFEGPHIIPGTRSATIDTPEYEQCYEAAAQYCLQLFASRKKSPKKKIYSHITTATDTANVSTVFDACRDIILKENLVLGGFYDAKDEQI
uniref:Uncharacterized protein n=1 Tax=Mucochytrium quahogii TaxID=96639 RepID=A0A7S2W737_9STRA|mmetsp:Transcript_4412/g.6581  ORF Transcript_4412/g.6581 Transcript_4412/m.6581 type:complete len:391 (+) Transcript_4412:310-1482(+)